MVDPAPEERAPESREPPQAPKGTHDTLWPESARWETVVTQFARTVEAAAYGLVVSPLFEYAEVFRRGIGEGSEVVGKEMYEFEDRDGRMLALRPEGTASVVRAARSERERPNMANSELTYPLVMTMSSRPRLMRSTTAMSSASLSGSWKDATRAAIWSRIVCVRAAMAAASANGEGR